MPRRLPRPWLPTATSRAPAVAGRRVRSPYRPDRSGRRARRIGALQEVSPRTGPTGPVVGGRSPPVRLRGPGQRLRRRRATDMAPARTDLRERTW
ncbi:hypothetical protein ACFPM0_15960 [Pseudonocardia sulfidoxydans]|uniref:hypothetical protein n=1 Tax=Pseudonocardia sulfidoxydans TaxID=54011 RepID=UPI003605E369